MWSTLFVGLTGILMLLGGIYLMRYGLQKILWNKFHFYLSNLTKTPCRSLLVGVLSAALLQSSTAVSLLTIGLVHSEYLSFYQGLGIVLGANIGTCSTVQLLTISISDKTILSLFAIAILIAIVTKKLRYLALGILGLLSMFTGMSILSEALNNISEISTVINYLVAAKENPIYGILGGIIITLLFQSSSAATGVLMVLAKEGILDLTTASYLVYGNNIGSCISSILVGATASLAAKRLAAAHIFLNILGTILFFPFTEYLAKIAICFTADFAGQVAIVHTVFNIVSSLAVLPIIRQYANLIILLVPGRK